MPAETRLEIAFVEVRVSSAFSSAATGSQSALASDGDDDQETWNITSGQFFVTDFSLQECPSSEGLQLLESQWDASPNSLGKDLANCQEGSIINVTVSGRYAVVDEINLPSMELYAGFVRTLVLPTYRVLSFDDNPISFVFELPTRLPQFGAVLQVVAPPGFMFKSMPFDLDESTLTPVEDQLSGRRALSLPDDAVVERSGPILTLRFNSELGTSLYANMIYGFTARLDCPHIRPSREDNRWVWQTYVEVGGGMRQPLHWAETPGFVLEGSIPQVEILPFSLVPLSPQNIVEVNFMLSLPLYRSAEPEVGVEWSARDRASRLTLIPPEGFIFPSQCEAPLLSIDDSTLVIAGAVPAVASKIVGLKRPLPPPYECIGSTVGTFSNATVMLIPTEDPHSGVLVQDQLYTMRLAVQNPLYDPSARRGVWQLLSRWGEAKGSFLTLHTEQLDTFPIRGMSAAVQPASVEPAAFHMLRVTFEARQIPAGSIGTKLVALLLVAPRGAELSCVGFLPGSLGQGTGPGGWVNAERIACAEGDGPLESGACAYPGFQLPPGLWKVCLSPLRQHPWVAVVNRTMAAGSLDFSVGVVNPSYLPADNMWVLAALGELPSESSDAARGRLLDVAGMPGYALIKNIAA